MTELKLVHLIGERTEIMIASKAASSSSRSNPEIWVSKAVKQRSGGNKREASTIDVTTLNSPSQVSRTRNQVRSGSDCASRSVRLQRYHATVEQR